MVLLTKQLKQFNSIAGSMRQNNILPILSYLKFEDGKITKNNLESFVTMEADFEGAALIDEKVLMSIVDLTDADEIEVLPNGTKVTLCHGGKKFNSHTDDIKNFPENILIDGEEIEITQDVIADLKVISNFTMERENLPFTSCVFLGNGVMAANTGFIAAVKKTEIDYPEIILEKNATSLIKSFNSIFFSQNNTYQFFTNGSFKFGFIKKETKYLNMSKFFEMIPKEGALKMDKYPLQQFCDICNSVCVGRVVLAEISGSKAIMKDPDQENDQEIPLPVELPYFSFNPTYMSKLLKSLPDDDLTFIKDERRYFVTGESGFISLIMEAFNNK